MSAALNDILSELRTYANSKNVEGMKRFGIRANQPIGISVPVLRGIAKAIGKNHALSQELWESKIHEARLLAVFIADYKQVTEKQMEKWVKDFASWDICDQACGLFDKTPYAFDKAVEWSKRKSEFEKRAGFVLMATLAVHDKKADDKKFISFFPLLEKEAHDERNFVKKAVNWAIRQIGKRNIELNKAAVELAKRIQQQDSKSAKWIAADALRELQSEKHVALVEKKSKKLKK
ncbi:MAG: DNA alkylation repair protein [Bacteroidetes bacterium]|nr:DNA alkylation repair protein [Bacteroidota bacterium]